MENTKFGEKLQVKMAYLVVGQDNESTATGWFNNDGQEFRIDGTECWVPAALWHANIVIALFTFQGLTIDVTKLWTSYNSERHCCDDSLHWLTPRCCCCYILQCTFFFCRFNSYILLRFYTISILFTYAVPHYCCRSRQWWWGWCCGWCCWGWLKINI